MEKQNRTNTAGIISVGFTGRSLLSKAFGIVASLFLAFCLVGCEQTSGRSPLGTKSSAAGTAANSGGSNSSTVESYREIYEVIAAYPSMQASDADTGRRAFETDGEAEGEGSEAPLSEEVPTAAGTQELAAADSSAGIDSGGYSETNAQVEGVDEGDIVKTNGSHIFIVSRNEVTILEAAAAETREVARVSLNAKTLLKEDSEPNWYSPRELYVHGDTLMVIYSYSLPEGQPSVREEGSEEEDASADDSSDSAPDDSADDSSDSAPDDSADSASAETFLLPFSYRQMTEVALFDIKDPAKPSFIKTFGQDGSYTSSRLSSGLLYLVSNHYIPSSLSDIDPEKPETFVPLMYSDSESELIAAEDIRILPENEGQNYSVVASVDPAKADRVDTQAILGRGETLYMNADNLFIAGWQQHSEEIESYQDGSFTVTTTEEGGDTHIVRLALDAGNIEFAAETVIPGSLLNQFSLDEYEGNLRAVTSISYYRSRVLDNGESKFYDSEPGDQVDNNALFVLDESLEVVGSIEGLAEDERVQSVRFDGEVGYFVTFRQVDPLFAVDLSDAQNPRIMSQLKIPGFSTYLHAWDSGRLLGLGMSATDEGQTTGMKLSMFDTEDPYAVSEKNSYRLEDSYSSALYNHKAIFISHEHDIIGFPVDRGYAIYGYSDEEGFYLREKFVDPADDSEDDPSPSWSSYYGGYSEGRGLFIEDALYICAADHAEVYALDTLEPLARVSIEVNDEDFGGVVPLGTYLE